MDVSMNLQARLGQHLNLSPQMLQSIHMLALGLVDLHELVMAEVEKNPVLTFPAAWQPGVSGTGLVESLTRAEAPSLRDDLRFQLHVSSLAGADLAIGEFIIDCIDARGYLTETVAGMAQLLDAKPEAVARVLGVIRTFEPAGVGAVDIRDSLLLQLQARPEPDACAIELVRNHLENVARERFSEIARLTGCDESRIRDAVALLRTLRLNPGEHYGDGGNRWILPEVMVTVSGGHVCVEPCNELPPVRVDDSYAVMAGDDEEACRFVRDALARATWLVQALDQRRRTLLQVANAIVQHQKSHFLEGAPPVPLTLEAIADGLGIAISTVSRAIGDRFYIFERQVHPFRDLFPSRLSTGESDAQIKALIQRLIRDEDRTAPLSDQSIATHLSGRGMTVARRTVAKYRTELGIDSASRRRR